MKKIILSLLCATGISATAFAAGGDVAVGMQVSNSSTYNLTGLGVKVQCELIDAFRLEPSFDYYFKHNSISAWDVNLNVHYLVNVTNKFDVYPLAGLGYVRFSEDLGNSTSYNQGRLAFNVGGGAEVALTHQVSFTGELRYQIMSDYSQFVPMVGVKYKF